MVVIFYMLLTVAGVVFVLNLVLYQRNVAVEHWDVIGVGSLFSGLWAISMVFVGAGLLVHPGLSWYYALLPLLGVPLGPVILRPVVHKILTGLKLADRPRE